MPTDGKSAEDDHELRRIVWTSILLLVGLMGALGLVLLLFRDSLLHLSHDFVEALGGPGVALGFFIPDAFTVPLPNDAFATFGLIGGMSFTEVVLWGTLGSLVGGNVGYLIGRYLITKSKRMQRFMERRGASLIDRLKRHGTVILVIAALTPLPYSIACWASGAVKIRYKTFFWVSLLRFFRVAGYTYLIQKGMLHSLGLGLPDQLPM